MSALPTTADAASPLRALESGERTAVIRALSTQLPPDEAVTILAALAGAPEEVVALPATLQERAELVLLEALPDGINAVVVSVLGLGNVPSDAVLPELRARFAGLSVEEAVALYRRLE